MTDKYPRAKLNNYDYAQGKPRSTHARALGGTKPSSKALGKRVLLNADGTRPKLTARQLREMEVMVPCCDLTIPELVEVLIGRSRRSNGFTSLTFKQRADLVLALIER